MSYYFCQRPALEQIVPLLKDSRAFFLSCSRLANTLFGDAEFLAGALRYDLVVACKRGYLPVVKWLHANDAADFGLYVYHYDKQINVDVSMTVADIAAANGHLAIVQWLHQFKDATLLRFSIHYAAVNGRLDVVQWLHDNHKESFFTDETLEHAAANGHLAVVKWLHEKGADDGLTIARCTNAIDQAADNNHLEVVKWLHENCDKGYINALDDAASNGNLAIVAWIVTNDDDACVWPAMERAIEHGHLHIAQWLHANCPVLQTRRAIMRAIDLAELCESSDTIRTWLEKQCPSPVRCKCKVPIEE